MNKYVYQMNLTNPFITFPIYWYLDEKSRSQNKLFLRQFENDFKVGIKELDFKIDRCKSLGHSSFVLLNSILYYNYYANFRSNLLTDKDYSYPDYSIYPEFNIVLFANYLHHWVKTINFNEYLTLLLKKIFLNPILVLIFLILFIFFKKSQMKKKMNN